MNAVRRPSVCLISIFLPIAFKQIVPGDPSARSDFVANEQLEGPDAELVARLNTAYRKVMVIGRSVFVPPIFSSRRAPFVFHLKQLRLLNQLTLTTDLDEACKKAEVSRSFANKFLKSADYLQFAAESVMDQAIQDGWTPRRIVVELDAIYRGEKKHLAEEQIDALKMLKDIVLPKKHDGYNPAGVTVNLNFPVLPPDVQAKLKVLADEAACIDVQADAA